MDAAEYLKFVEGAAAFVDAVTHIRDALLEKGWTKPGAETAAIQIITKEMGRGR